MASQWPIPPGHYFDYELATEVYDAGTYFYHSHVDRQALSCVGPLIVSDCGLPPYRYDDERIFQFQDHFSMTDDDMLRGLRAAPFAWSGETRGILLNGKGVAVGQTAVTGPPGGITGLFGSPHSRPIRPRHGKLEIKNDSDEDENGDETEIELPNSCTLPVIDVEPGKTYRFRFIGSTGLSYLGMAFEDHSSLTIVQVDGNEYNIPVTTDHLRLGAGQRFDVIFKAKTAEELKKNGNKSTYFFQFETIDRPQPYRGYGVLRYNINAKVPAAPPSPVLNLPIHAPDWLEYTFQPLYPERNQAPSAKEVTRRVIIDVEQKAENKTGRVVWQLAHLSWFEYNIKRPVLIDIYERGEAAMPNYEAARNNYGWDPATALFPAKIGEVLEIVIQNRGSQFKPILGLIETHPFHAHGQHYYDIGSGPGKYDPNANNEKLAKTGYRAVKRDTTMLLRYQDRVGPGEPGGWRAWRMRVEMPGVWMIHCHILAHMMMGECCLQSRNEVLLLLTSFGRHANRLGDRRRGSDRPAPVACKPGLLRLRGQHVRECNICAHGQSLF
jgi:L-ascorbate oxidase